MDKPLEGFKVIEISAWAFVPSAGAVLADWGAEVIKIEPPSGDPIRGLVYMGIDVSGPTYTFEMWNRGKKGMALDLTHEASREIVLSLVEEADVFLTSYLPATRAKLGIDVDDIRARNPGIIFAAGTGFGPRGDEAGKGGYDSISFWARSGIAASVTPPDYPRPVGMPSGAFGDSLSGMSLAGSISAALLRRERTGEGAIVDVSLLSTSIWAMQMAIVGSAVMASSAPPAGTDAEEEPAAPAVFNPLVNNYRTSDGRWVALCMLQFEPYWQGLCRAIGREDLVTDERFTDPDTRPEHFAAFIQELEATFATRPLAHWRERLATQAGQWDVVQRPDEIPADPQALANGFVQTVDYPGGHSLPLVASPGQFDRTPLDLRPGPAFGEHTDEILQSLGMDWDEIIEHKTSGAVV